MATQNGLCNVFVDGTTVLCYTDESGITRTVTTESTAAEDKKSATLVHTQEDGTVIDQAAFDALSTFTCPELDCDDPVSVCDAIEQLQLRLTALEEEAAP